MNIIIGVEKFGKIEKTEITLGKLVLFVGENNSGKTYMMQLLYGVIPKIINYSKILMAQYEKGTVKYTVTPEKILLWEKEINEYLDKEKKTIIRDIFYRDIPIGSIYMKLVNVNVSYEVEFPKRERLHDIPSNSEITKDNFYNILIKETANGIEKNKRTLGVGTEIGLEFAADLIGKMIAADMLGMNSVGSALFFPAFRTGMLQLYKYFFAEKDNNIYVMDEREKEYAGKNQLGLSAPVYNFLQFLLKYTPDHLIRKKDQNILDFIESHLIDGKLQFNNAETYYIPQNSEDRIPLYLSSSLINELAPIVKMLSNIYPYDNIYYDEIETCLHPLKQKAMARLIMRLVNSGRRLIVSTHSDSMAINMNNLLTFTLGNMSEDAKNKKMSELDLEEDDIPKTKDIHVYQFTNSDHGTSNVRELEFRTVNNLGYDFELFSKNLQNLSDDTIKLME